MEPTLSSPPPSSKASAPTAAPTLTATTGGPGEATVGKKGAGNTDAETSGLAAITQVRQQQQEAPDPDAYVTERRTSRRRPAAPSRERIAANDDVPSIGGLIYALNQRPSRKPFGYAIGASATWTVLVAAFAWFVMLPQAPASTSGLLGHPWFLGAIATWLGPISLFWFLASLSSRSEELHLRSTAMTEVAVRLAEPDRLAEQSVASLGQAVRRQVSFMNDAVSRALGRAGELEALVHKEVTSLEHSYEENERKIRGLISELSGERTALLNTGQRFQHTLQSLGQDVPALIEKLNTQQVTLAKLIGDASENLSTLETAIGQKTGQLESTVGERTEHLHRVLEDYTSSLNTTLGRQSDEMQGMLTDYTMALGYAFDNRTNQMRGMLEAQREGIEQHVDTIAGQLEQHNLAINQHTKDITGQLEQQQENIEAAINDRTQTLQTVFETYARALDTTLANRARSLDTQLVERTKSLDDAFAERLRLFDEAILRSTMAIDDAVGDNARSLTAAMEQHADHIRQSLSDEAEKIDQNLLHGIDAIRSTSENISQQSLKAIEGLAGQADMLRHVSENLLGQIHSVTNRFENQGQAILKSANALEGANSRIDRALEKRNEDLNQTLDRMSGKADELGRVVEGYSNTLEGSLTTAEQRARLLTEEMSRGAQERSRAALEDIERFKTETSREADRALAELRNEFQTVSREVTERLGSLSSEFSQTTGAVRQQAAKAAQQLETEQSRLRKQLELLPNATKETSAAMRSALQDQLRALDRLTELASRVSHNSYSSAPSRTPVPLTPQPAPPPKSSITPPATEKPRNLTNLTSTLARELGARQAKRETDDSGDGHSDRWSLGDLLARASEADGGAASTGHAGNDGHARASVDDGNDASGMQPDDHERASGGGSPLDLSALAKALDTETASAIWARFRKGQRGFMVRSIYAPEARKLFESVERRYATDPAFQSNVDRFLMEFERGLHELDQKDSSRQASDAQILTDTGRVYLVLAHAAKRLT